MMRKTAADYHTLAAQKSLVWLGPEIPTNVFSKTGWQCPHGHQWQTTYNIVNQKKGGCPYCVGNQRKTAADYHALAASRGFVWLGPEVPNKYVKSWWTCEQGHRWAATWDSVREGYGCRECKGTLPKQPVDYERLAEQKGVRWLGPVAGNTKTPTRWGCEHSHEWWATYDGVRVGKGCNFCRLQKQRDKTE